jgi:hypothetical protein
LVINVSEADYEKSSRINHIDSEKELFEEEKGDIHTQLEFSRDVRFEAEEIKKAFTHHEFSSIPVKKHSKANATAVGVTLEN